MLVQCVVSARILHTLFTYRTHVVSVAQVVDRCQGMLYTTNQGDIHKVKKKTMPMRLDEDVRKAINMIAGEYQRKTGKLLSISDALRMFIAEHAPAIADEAELSKKLQSDDPKK